MKIYVNAKNLTEDIIPIQRPLNEVVVEGEMRVVYQLNLLVFYNATWKEILQEVKRRHLRYVPEIKGIKLLNTYYNEETNMSYVKATLV